MASSLMRASRNLKRCPIRMIQRAEAHGSRESGLGGRGTPSRGSSLRPTSFQFAWPGLRRYTAGAGKGDAPQGNEEYLEFGSHKAAAAKRFVVGTTAVNIEELPEPVHVDEEVKEKAKEVLQEVGEKLDDILGGGERVEEAQVRQLQEKLVTTEGISDVVQDMYNQREEYVESSSS